MVKKLSLFFITFLFSILFASIYVENGMVVFTFEVDAQQVYLAGNFNNWSVSANPMVNENGVWKISLELLPGEYQYKFVVDGSRWIEDPDAPSYVDDGYGGKNGAFLLVNENGKLVIKPVGGAENNSNTGNESQKYEVNTLREDTIFVDEEGYVVIRYYNPDAAYVMIAGDFNNWDAEDLEMYDIGDGWWEAALELDSGVYQYKFVVNGETWVEDPNAFAYLPDGFGGKNSVLKVYEENGKLRVGSPVENTDEKVEKKEIPLGVSIIDGKVYFKVEKPQASKAYLAGSFNNWNPQDIEMQNVDGYWQVSLVLSPGKYEYKYVFEINNNQTWQEDPNAPGYVPDGYGGKNGVFEIVEKDETLVIEKPEQETKSSVGISGSYSFNLSYKYDEQNILKGQGFSNSLELIYQPNNNLEFSLKYDGASINYAKLELINDKLGFLAHYNYVLDFPFEGLETGIFVSYDEKYYLGFGADNNQLSWIVGLNIFDIEVNYSDNYFAGESVVIAGYNLKLFDYDTKLYGGYFINSNSYAALINVNLEDFEAELKYVKDKVEFLLSMNYLDLISSYNIENGSYNIDSIIYIFDKYGLLAGYNHTTLLDKWYFGCGIYKEDYNLGFKIRSDFSGYYFDLFGNISF
ncbi:isoamylase early set domain-containing protein [Thermosipho sp. (in: thermotogales)]|jgi:hypothetical protein|uniref:isoamylase early set domain-containing protein n=1 Tax=Thermosipho sp. (in: thermotogales) TaxID=1968895 RepID=UPI00257D2CC3|nr:isoamylase early set domain-containing protein [Thermosipho sp. (in: thermotogales)]MBZ4650613.1 glycoside hydrolase family 13 [Thermosipho sp. (in: thermotogales)]